MQRLTTAHVAESKKWIAVPTQPRPLYHLLFGSQNILGEWMRNIK